MRMEHFLDTYVPRMLRYLDNASTALIADPELDAFIRELEDTLEQVEGPLPGVRPWLPGEDTFFWCLDQLALLADPSNGCSRDDPWAQREVADLRAMALRLRARENLPPGRSVEFILPFDENHPEWDPAVDGLDEAWEEEDGTVH